MNDPLVREAFSTGVYVSTGIPYNNIVVATASQSELCGTNITYVSGAADSSNSRKARRRLIFSQEVHVNNKYSYDLSSHEYQEQERARRRDVFGISDVNILRDKIDNNILNQSPLLASYSKFVILSNEATASFSIVSNVEG